MKFACDSCHARYSIADEKLRGKVVRVRCKRCGSSILLTSDVLEKQDAAFPGEDSTTLFDTAKLLKESEFAEEEPEGDAPKFVSRSSLLPTQASARPLAEIMAAAAASPSIPPPPPPPPPEKSEWFILINKEEIGPMTPSELKERASAGKISRRTYMWRDGQASWERLEKIAPLKDVADLLPAAPVTASTASNAPPVKVRVKVEPPKAKSTPRSSPKVEPERGAATRPETPMAQQESVPTPSPDLSDKTMIANPKAELQAQLVAEAASWADDAARAIARPTPKSSAPIKQKKPDSPANGLGRIPTPLSNSPSPIIVDSKLHSPPDDKRERPKTPAHSPGALRNEVTFDNNDDGGELELMDDRTEVQKAPVPIARADDAPVRSDTAPMQRPAVAADSAATPVKNTPVDDSRPKPMPRPPPPKSGRLAIIVSGIAVAAVASVLFLQLSTPRHTPKHHVAVETPAPAPAPAAPAPSPALPAEAAPQPVPDAGSTAAAPQPAAAPAPEEHADAKPDTAEEEPEKHNDHISAKTLAKKMGSIKPSVERCVTSAMQHHPGLRLGKVNVHVTVMSIGRIAKVSYDRAGFGKSDLGLCIEKKIKALSLPSFHGPSQDSEFPLDLSSE